MHGLPYFLEEEDRSGKHAFLVLRIQPGADVHALSVKQLLGAALLFEYRALGRRTGAFVAQDLEGLRAVIAPQADREEMAATAAVALIEHGAHLVLVSFAGGAAGTAPLSRPTNATRVLGRKRVHLTARERSIETSLKMQPTYSATLAALGKSTRFNLGYYRRRLIAAHGCEFVPDAAARLDGSEQEAFNAGSLNPMTSERFLRAWEATASLPGGFVCGLRTATGQWLSFIGGWRQGRTTLLQWQCNAAGFEKFSLTTAMRSFFLAHEIQNGAESLIIAGATRTRCSTRLRRMQ